MKNLLSVLAMTLYSFGLLAGGDYILGIRGNEMATSAYVEQNQNASSVIAVTKEFDNGNTFVQLQTEVGGKNVKLLLPSIFSANTFMETLIKVFTLRSEGALSIEIVTPQGLNEFPFDLKEIAREIEFVEVDPIYAPTLRNLMWQMLHEAGATSVASYTGQRSIPLQGNPEYINRPQALLRSKVSLPIAIDSHQYPEFGEMLGGKLGLQREKVLSDSSSSMAFQKDLEMTAHQVINIVPAGTETNRYFLEFLASSYSYAMRGHQVVGIMPYFHYSRTDKVDQSGVAITGTLIASMIERFGISAMVFSRLHAPQSQGLFRYIPTVHVSTRDTINEFLRSQNVEAVVAPDNGAAKESTLFADALEVPVETINKQRDPVSGRTSIRGISGKDTVIGKVVAVIDDETASGGTGKEVATYLKQLGVKKVIFVVSHLAGNAKKALESEDIDKMVVTNTLPIEQTGGRNLEVLDVSGELLRELSKKLGLPVPDQCKNSI